MKRSFEMVFCIADEIPLREGYEVVDVPVDGINAY